MTDDQLVAHLARFKQELADEEARIITEYTVKHPIIPVNYQALYDILHWVETELHKMKPR